MGIMAIEVEVKKIGNSLGIIIPNDIVNEKSLKPHSKVSIEIVKKADLRDMFGILKGKTNMTAQEFKDLAREGWE